VLDLLRPTFHNQTDIEEERMNCPKCDVPTEEVEIKAVKVNRCPDCGGTWYDQDELRRTKDKESGGSYRWIDVDLWEKAEKFHVAEQSGYKCPNDGATLGTVHYGESNVAVDICPRCFGIWLDQGEYEKIVRHLEEKVDSETFAEYLADVEEEFVELFKGKEGLRSELGDLAKVFHLLRLRFAVEHPAIVTIKEAIRHLFPE